MTLIAFSSSMQPSVLSVILTDHLADQIELDRGRSADFVLMSARRTAYSKRRAHVLFAKAAKKANLGVVRPHDCRHSYGSILLDKNVPLPEVSKYLGHANVATTAKIYAGVLEGRERHNHALVDGAFGGSGCHEVATTPDSASAEATENADMQVVS